MHGIGGHTVAECREKLSYREFLLWCAYIEKHGSLNIGTRIEQSSAIVATVAANVAGNKKKVIDFMPHYQEKKSEKVLSLEEAFGALKAVANEPKTMRLRKDK